MAVSGRLRILGLAPAAELSAALATELDELYDLTVVAEPEAVFATADTAALVIVPERCGDTSGLTIAGQLDDDGFSVPVILVSSSPEAPEVVAAIRLGHITGAVNVPWRRSELAIAAQRALELADLRAHRNRARTRTQMRLDALTAMTELSGAISDLDSHTELARVVAQSLFSIVPAGVGAVILAPGATSAAHLHIHCHERVADGVLSRARDHSIAALATLTNRAIDESTVIVDVTGQRATGDADDGAPVKQVAIRIGSQVVGLIVLTAYDDSAIAATEERLLDFLAAQAAAAARRITRRMSNLRRRLTLMVESMADGLILTDTGSDLVLINPAGRRMLGIDDAQNVTTLFLKDKLGFYPFDLVATRPTVKGGDEKPLREEVRVGERLFHSIVSPVRDGAGKLVGVVVVLRDMTEAKELARRQQEFVSVMSHELRTPLTSISGALDILLSGYAGPTNVKTERYLRMARDSSTRLNTIVDDLLDIARSDSTRMPIHFTPLRLDELAHEVVERYRGAAQTKQVDLDVRSDKVDIRIVGDADRLTQVLTNLLSNAIKFTPHSGTINVEIFGPSVASDHVGVSVFNNGIPIPEDAQERIFDKFEQLEGSATRHVGGTGLGLAISRAIVEAHGGRIWVESDDDGTKFVFTLPSAPDSSQDVEESLTEKDIGRRPPTSDVPVLALIIDDDEHSTYILKGLLMASGHDVILARTLEDGLTLARDRKPDLAVVHVSEGSSDGIALLEILRHDPDTRKTGVVVVADATDRERALAAGANEFLPRPIRPADLREACQRVVQESGQDNAKRVLIVDDDPTIRVICREVLERAGYSVQDVGDGRAALATAKAFRPDLMVLDVMMPDMDGFTTAERFRAESATSMTPIIFLSARGETHDKVRAFRSGAEDYVVKPFDAAELVARVAKALERHAREVGASPTTQLPGALSIEREIDRRLGDGGDYAFCYLDLDNLKAFNDYYGYAKADGIIRQTGDLIRDVISRVGGDNDFIGHIAGDDFVLFTTAARVDSVCRTICETFDRLVPLYYNKVDRERGFIETKDRYGELRKFPVMTVSIAAVTLRSGNIGGIANLATAAAEGKKLAKAVSGSSYVRDGRVILGAPPQPADVVA